VPTDTQTDELSSIVKKLKAKEQTFIQLESIAQLGSWEIDLLKGTTKWSKQSYKIYGEDETVSPTLELFLSHVVPEDLDYVVEAIKEIQTSSKVITRSCRIKRTDQQIRHIIISAQTIFENNKPVKILGSTQDITEQVQLKQHTKELSELIDNSLNEIYIINANALEYLYVNKGACDALGYTKEELLKMSVLDINPYITQEEIDTLHTKLKEQKKVLNRTIHKRKDGSFYHVQSFLHPLTYHNQDAYVIFDIDISKQIEDEIRLQEQAKQLDYQANHDSLTQLPNRTLFQDRLEQTIASSKRNNEKFALFFLDLDQFKQINDSLGHHIGDEVLIETASRLQETIRDEDTLARLGGDEFTIILRNIHNPQSAATVAQKIIDIMNKPILVKSHTLYISSSIGISLYPDDSTSQENLVKFADTAMYKAKEEGRDNYQFYSSEMTSYAFERVVMESSLRIAIKEEQFVVFYQPQFCTDTKKIVGMEALVRWEHPALGLVSPAKFIPIAEETGLIIEIDRIVMKKAMKQFAYWYEKGLNPGILALNLAMKQLNDKDFSITLLQTMKSLNFKPTWLELEVTEGEVMNNPELSIEKLNKLHDIGIEIAIDDFGTGYSSLSNLNDSLFDKLKIDRSFIVGINKKKESEHIIKATIAIAKSLNLKVLAEGVESIEQLEFLKKHNCDEVQGYYYSRPILPQEIFSLYASSL
jgi:diguanylate cyclase (GGDEF)-like protein/PAS domain S-box-containing protein